MAHPHNTAVQQIAQRYSAALQEKGIEVHEGIVVVAVEAGCLLVEAGRQPEAFDECLWCTQASAPAWLRHTDLSLGKHAPL